MLALLSTYHSMICFISVESQLQGKRLKWLGHVFRMPNDRLPKKLLFGESRGFAHLAAVGLVSMLLHYVIVKTVVLIGLIGMHKTGCFGETRLIMFHQMCSFLSGPLESDLDLVSLPENNSGAM